MPGRDGGDRRGDRGVRERSRNQPGPSREQRGGQRDWESRLASQPDLGGKFSKPGGAVACHGSEPTAPVVAKLIRCSPRALLRTELVCPRCLLSANLTMRTTRRTMIAGMLGGTAAAVGVASAAPVVATMPVMETITLVPVFATAVVQCLPMPAGVIRGVKLVTVTEGVGVKVRGESVEMFFPDGEFEIECVIRYLEPATGADFPAWWYSPPPVGNPANTFEFVNRGWKVRAHVFDLHWHRLPPDSPDKCPNPKK